MHNFAWYVDIGLYPVSWPEQGDDWRYYFARAIGDLAPGVQQSGWGYGPDSAPFFRLSFTKNSQQLDVSALVGQVDAGIGLLAAGNDDPEWELINLLPVAANLALQQLASAGEDKEWWAVIGHPETRLGGGEIQLEHPLEIGGMHLSSSDVKAIDVDAPLVKIHSNAFHSSVPIVVHGKTPCHSWDSGSVRAARDLRTLCGLLSLAFKAELVVRYQATPNEWGGPFVPHKPFWLRDDVLEGMVDGANMPGRVVEGPNWLEAAWDRLASDSKLRGALDAYLEGLYASINHPSLATVCFTATVEVIAEKMFHPRNCPECHTKLGIRQRFEAALSIALPEDEAAALGPAYKQRSNTVHSGQLHGGETAPGMFFGMTSNASARGFRWQTLNLMKKAAATLLEKGLKGQLPARTHLPAPGGNKRK